MWCCEDLYIECIKCSIRLWAAVSAAARCCACLSDSLKHTKVLSSSLSVLSLYFNEYPDMLWYHVMRWRKEEQHYPNLNSQLVTKLKLFDCVWLIELREHFLPSHPNILECLNNTSEQMKLSCSYFKLSFSIKEKS